MRRELILLMAIPFMMGLMGQAAAEKKISVSGLPVTSAQQSRGFERKDKVESQIVDGVPARRFTASFSGYDLKERAVWLGDSRFELYPGYKVVGKHSKRGTLSSIQLNEMVDVVVKENKKKPSTPYLVEIRRRGK